MEDFLDIGESDWMDEVDLTILSSLLLLLLIEGEAGESDEGSGFENGEEFGWGVLVAHAVAEEERSKRRRREAEAVEVVEEFFLGDGEIGARWEWKEEELDEGLRRLVPTWGTKADIWNWKESERERRLYISKVKNGFPAGGVGSNNLGDVMRNKPDDGMKTS